MCCTGGEFGAYMQVHIQNDGPVTIQLETPAIAPPKQVGQHPLMFVFREACNDGPLPYLLSSPSYLAFSLSYFYFILLYLHPSLIFPLPHPLPMHYLLPSSSPSIFTFLLPIHVFLTSYSHTYTMQRKGSGSSVVKTSTAEENGGDEDPASRN